MTYIETIEEYPIPFDREEIVDIQVEQVGEPFGLRSYSEVITSVDAFHERYIDEKIRTHEWSVFRNFWNASGYMYFWNHQLGYGIRVDENWETMCGFVKIMDEFTDEYSSKDFEPTYYPWELP